MIASSIIFKSKPELLGNVIKINYQKRLKNGESNCQNIPSSWDFLSSFPDNSGSLIKMVLRGSIFIFWTLETLRVLRYHLKFALKSLIFFNITTFRTFCHLSVICVVYSDFKIVSEQKNWINSWKFSSDDLLRLST